MDNNAFWAFFTVAIIAGFAIGMVFTGTGITGSGVVDVRDLLPFDFGETDFGLDYANAGTCTDSAGTFQDFCANTGTVLEYVFNEANQRCSAVAYSCVLGPYRKCQAGACVNGRPDPLEIIGGGAASSTGAIGEQTTTGAIGEQTTTGAIGEQTTTGAIGEQTTTGAIGSGGVFHETSTSQSIRSSLKSTRTSFFKQTGFFFTFGEEALFMSTDGKVLWVLTNTANAMFSNSGSGTSFECTGTFIQTSFGAVCQGGSSSVGNIMLGQYETPA